MENNNTNNNNNINNILNQLPDKADIVINYYDRSTITYYNLDDYRSSSELPRSPQPERRNKNTEFNVNISRDEGDNSPTAQINATIDYNTGLDNINQIVNITDALSRSISESLENIEFITPTNLSLRDILAKTILFVCKGDITELEDKCHICNESYNEFDICRKNNACNHYFHQSCIDSWYSGHNKCPICQQLV